MNTNTTTYAKSGIIGYNILNFLEVTVAPPTLVEAQPPVGRHVRSTYDLCVLLDDRLGIRTKEEVEVKDTCVYQYTCIEILE